MKRWLFLVTAVACLWGCSDEAPQTTGSGTGSASSGSGGASNSSSSGGGGEQPSALVPCLDEPDGLPRPPSGKLPCEYVPPGLSLPQ
ncbi:hypothetical protein [Polyangium aurulentum]|uniref:hypothetical protein n=1 Tax=Polyangium aurulentum TaxID=2567896 RepID=UPI0010ADF2C7|nr:hypothetical protein [Polyangium aurulentum]UQA58381.1 hypothetical protein E8A73_045245 [Polyangium aurulentum]